MVAGLGRVSGPRLCIAYMSGLGDVPVFVQPMLQMKASTAAKIAAGTAYQIGGVVRELETGRLVELLKDAAPLEEGAKQAVGKAAEISPKLNLPRIDLTKIGMKTAGALGGLVLLGGAAVGGYMWIRQQKRTEEPTPAVLLANELNEESIGDPECLVSFRASLKAYVDAGTRGQLTPEIVEKLVTDLGAVEEYSSQGAVVFTFEELMPFLELVTAHTPRLAEAYDAELDEAALEGGDVLSLRRHLEVQKTILSKAA